MLTSAFLCVPVRAFWEPDLAGAHCINRTFVWFFHASINILTDLIIFIIPIPVISSLKLPRKQKILVMFLFGLGVL